MWIKMYYHVALLFFLNDHWAIISQLFSSGQIYIDLYCCILSHWHVDGALL